MKHIRINSNRFKTPFIIFSLLLMPFYGFSSENLNNKYLEIVQNFADQLLEVGADRYGPEKTAMWASVIDLQDLSVPVRNVPPTEGVRPHDRAMGGSNYYHDVMTMKVFEALSEMTGNEKYVHAVNAYSKDFLELTQNPETGLLGWGEHLFYDLYRDTVTIADSKIYDQMDYFRMPHELLAYTPPWERLWSINEKRTANAIEGIMWHFNGPDTRAYLFWHHAAWNEAQYQKTVMPFIKHSVLFAYSFAFLYSKTGEDIWLKRANDVALLFWNLRNYDTDLVFRCLSHIFDPDEGKTPTLSSTGGYAYWMYKTAELLQDDKLKETAKTLMLAYQKYGWNKEEGYFYQGLLLDGHLPEEALKANVWKIGYGSSSLFQYARAAAYIAKKENNIEFLQLAKDCEIQIPGSKLPDEYTALNLGQAINFYIDLYELTEENYYLEEAKKYADLGIANFTKNLLLTRQTNDRYYEAKLGIGDLLSGLFRIGMISEGKARQLSNFDFSH